MKIFLAFALTLTLSQILPAQGTSREQKLRQVADLSAELNKIVVDLLQPSTSDLKNAEADGLEVFRLMPREVFANTAVPQGGGSYYSFTNRSSDYQKVAQISLEQRFLQTGFAGANYGLMADLGDVPLGRITSETPEFVFLLKYRSATNIVDARKEQYSARDYKVDGLVFKDRLPAAVGHTYALRTIYYGMADIAVAFRIERMDSDGSLIISWKKMGDFARPTLDPNIKEQ